MGGAVTQAHLARFEICRKKFDEEAELMFGFR